MKKVEEMTLEEKKERANEIFKAFTEYDGTKISAYDQTPLHYMEKVARVHRDEVKDDVIVEELERLFAEHCKPAETKSNGKWKIGF